MVESDSSMEGREEAAAAPAQSAQPAPAPASAPSAPEPGRGTPWGSPITNRATVYLPNADDGEFYSVNIPNLGRTTGLELKDPGGSGLALSEDKAQISGRPIASGEYTLVFHALVDGRPTDITAHLAVIPDPRSLWVSKPSDPLAPFWKEDEHTLVAQGDLLCVGASKRGRSHAQEGTCRDDHFGVKAMRCGWHIAVVADGAGSAQFSRLGSKIAVDTVLAQLPALLAEHFGDDLESLADRFINGQQQNQSEAEHRIRTSLYLSLAAAAHQAAVAIHEKAEDIRQSSSEASPGANTSASDFSTTLIVTLARRLQAGWFVAAFSIGDGGAALVDLSGDGGLNVLTSADSGQFAGQTRFLHRSEFKDASVVAERLSFAVVPKFTFLAVMTDGISDPKFPTDSAFADLGAWDAFWQDITADVDLTADPDETAVQLLSWMDFWSPGNHDDRTLVLILPQDER